MGSVPPARVVAAAQLARAGLSALRRSIVPTGVALLDSINDFWSFHIVYSLAELKVVDALRGRPRSADALARELHLSADHLYRLLRSASMLGFVREEPGYVFVLKPLGEALCEDPHGSFRDYILFMGRHGTRFWPLLPECIRQGKTGIELATGMKPFEYFTSEPEILDSFNRAMTAVSNVSCEAIAAAYDFAGCFQVVDVGGGHGRLLAELLRQNDHLHGVLFDLPEVVAGALPTVQSLGVSSRIERVGGSFFESVPSGADCYIAKTIIHDWHDAEARSILANVRRAIKPHGKLLLCECVVPAINQPHFAKLLDMEMVVHGGGRERTEAEYRTLLRSEGFELKRIVPTAAPLSVIEARPV